LDAPKKIKNYFVLQFFSELTRWVCCFLWQAELAVKLPHVRSLCFHEMVACAYKHVLQAVIVASNVKADLAVNIATTLSMMLGTPEKQDPNMESSLIWNWVETFVCKRFGWKLTKETTCSDIRKYAILRGLCHKV
jgi:protein TIF31